jgi:hypothetical protein
MRAGKLVHRQVSAKHAAALRSAVAARFISPAIDRAVL